MSTDAASPRSSGLIGPDERPAAIDPEATRGPASMTEILAVLRELRPRPCPYPLVRIGGSCDGAYLVPDDLEGIDACFSPGVAGRKEFEDDLAKNHGIRSHMCDHSTDEQAFRTPLLAETQTFTKRWLDVDDTADSITLAEWVAGREPGHGDLLLQMDIEGAEYRNVTATPGDVLSRFRIIVMEIHGLARLRNRRFLQQVFGPFLESLRGFTSVHVHPNNCCGDWLVPGTTVRVPYVLEWTLLRNDRIERAPTATRLPPLSPHPLDIHNDLDRGSQALGSWWIAPSPPSASLERTPTPTSTATIATVPEGMHVSKIRDVSRSSNLPRSPRSPIAGRRSPLADVLARDATLQKRLEDSDVELVFAFLDLPHKAVGQEPSEILTDVGGADLERLRGGRTYLAIDQSSEGTRHLPEFSRLIHDWCALHGVPPASLIYVNANQAYEQAYRRWCQDAGITEHYAHVFFNAYVHEIAALAADLDAGRLRTQLLRHGPRPHRFLSFNNAVRPTRLMVTAYMLGAAPPDALVSVGGTKGQATPARALEFIEDRLRGGSLLERHPLAFADLDVDTLRARATLPPPESGGAGPLYRVFDLERYAQTGMSVVTESEMSGGLVCRVTEKTVKPFLFGHLAIVAGNPGSLRQVRELGFETFGTFIDEGYDEITEPRARLCAVLCEIDRLRGLDARTWLDVLEESHAVRATNLEHGVTALRPRIEDAASKAVARRIFDGASSNAPSP